MKKLLIISLAFACISAVNAVEQELRELAKSLTALTGTLNEGAPLPPLPKTSTATTALTPEELAAEQELATRIIPIPEELMPPLPTPKPGGTTLITGPLPPPPSDVLPPFQKTDAQPVPTPPGDVLPLDVKPEPQPDYEIPTPPDDTKEKPATPKEQQPTDYVPSSPSIAMPRFKISNSQEVVLIPNKLSMRAVIGITENDNLVVWGPQLKAEPTATTFIHDKKFMYPGLDVIDYKVVGGKVAYATYIVVNMDELKTQKQNFNTQLRDKLRDQIREMNQAVKEGRIPLLLDILQNRAPQITENTLAIIKQELLHPERLYPESFNENVLSVDQIKQMIDDLEDAVKNVINNVLKEFGKLIKTKQDVYKQYVAAKGQADINLALLAKQWERDKGYESTRTALRQITNFDPQLNARFNAISDWENLPNNEIKELIEMLKNALEATARVDAFSKPLSSSEESIKAQLKNLKENKGRNELGKFYKDFQKTLTDVLVQQQKAEDMAKAQQAFEASAQAGAERLKKLAEQKAKEQEKESDEDEDVWED